MKKFIYLLAIIISLFLTSNIYAENMPFSNYIVRDISSGRIFEEKASNIKVLPASTTKVMTAIVAIENSDLSDVFKVGEEILTMDGANIYLEMGEHILFQDLLYGMILRSGNDAAMTIAQNVSGSVQNFVRLMNEKARSLKMTNTIFNNPTGLDDFEKNYTTMTDLSKVYSYAYQNETFRKIVSSQNYETKSDKKSYYFNNRMDFLKLYDKATGGKTGYTPDAGRLLITSASNKDLDIVIVTHGNTYGYPYHKQKYEEIFSKYKNYEILDKDNFHVDSTLEGKLYIKNSFSYPLAENEVEKISKKMIFNNKKEGIVGEVNVYLEDELIHKENIYLKSSNNSWWNKIISFFKNLT